MQSFDGWAMSAVRQGQLEALVSKPGRLFKMRGGAGPLNYPYPRSLQLVGTSGLVFDG